MEKEQNKNLEDIIEGSIVRCNLLENVNYRPYCGNNGSRSDIGGCHNPRTEYRHVDGQFICPNCKWISKFPPEFVNKYQEVHNLKNNN